MNVLGPFFTLYDHFGDSGTIFDTFGLLIRPPTRLIRVLITPPIILTGPTIRLTGPLIRLIRPPIRLIRSAIKLIRPPLD